MATDEQMVRVMALLQALSASRRGVVLSRFAEEHGWPPRYVRRDLQTLERAGFPVTGERGRYGLDTSWAPRFAGDVDAEELVALFLARQMATPMRGTAAGRALDRLWAKLSAADGNAVLLPASGLAVAARAPAAIDYAAHRARIAALERAINKREAVRCRYRRPRTGEITDRIIEPGELYVDSALESMYCIAWCRLRADVRVFAVHRFLEVSATGERAPMRPETRSRVALKEAFRVWRSDTVERVRLEFAPALASEIQERRWHASQTITPLVGGGVVLTLEVADPAELERWILGFGPEVVVLEPGWLAERVRGQHAAAARVQAGGKRPAKAAGKAAAGKAGAGKARGAKPRVVRAGRRRTAGS